VALATFSAIVTMMCRLRSKATSLALSPVGADAVENAILEADNAELSEFVASIQVDRARTLREVYDRSGSNTRESVSIATLEQGLGLERQRLHGIIKWLADRYLIKAWTMGSVVIMQEGIDSIEVAREKPEEPAISGLSAFNSIEVSNSPGATVMAVQGSPGANVTFIVQRDERRLGDLRELLDRIRDEVDLDDEGQAALEAVQAQAEMGRSDSPIIHAGLDELRAFAAGVGASAIGTPDHQLPSWCTALLRPVLRSS
jgi:hypothetical protein